jgi:Flp pilus assembly protein TadG
MSSLRNRINSDSGQAFVFVAFTLMVLVGMAALVVDGGSWYRADRRLQTAADAAALGGAQELPLRQSQAQTVALDFAQRNYAGIPAPTVAFPNSGTIDVTATATAPGIFARIYGAAFNTVTVHAHAQAQVLAPGRLMNVAPIGVQRDFACAITNPSCFGRPLTLSFDDDDVTRSKFGLLDLDRNGRAGTADMNRWIRDGYPDYLSVNVDYPAATGDKNGLKNELQDAAAQKRVLLFPVFDTASATTGFHVIGWAAFVIDEVVQWNGSRHVLTGHYTTLVATDLASGGTIANPDNDFGVHVITLTQ